MPILIPKIKAFVKGKPPRFTIFTTEDTEKTKKTQSTQRKNYIFLFKTQPNHKNYYHTEVQRTQKYYAIRFPLKHSKRKKGSRGESG